MSAGLAASVVTGPMTAKISSVEGEEATQEREVEDAADHLLATETTADAAAADQEKAALRNSAKAGASSATREDILRGTVLRTVEETAACREVDTATATTTAGLTREADRPPETTTAATTAEREATPWTREECRLPADTSSRAHQ